MSRSPLLFPFLPALCVAGLAASPILSAQDDAAVLAASRKAPDPASLAPLPAERRKGFDSIDPELCREWLSYLASDELEGRETGRPGYRKAADFVAKHFKEWGLKPVGDDGSYFQAVPFVSVAPDPATSHMTLLDAEGEELLKVAVGSGVGGRIGENSDARAPLVVSDASATDPDLEALRDKMVLIDGEMDRRSMFGLYRAGVAGLITVSDEGAQQITERISLDTGGRDRVRDARRRTPNSYVLSTAVANQVKKLAAGAAGVEMRMHVEVKKAPVFAANVVGLLEGSDPQLKAEIVGVGSHLDHVGVAADGQIRNGADDDGSGTTGVLAVVRAFHENGVRPKRSILFMCFSGEEKGLIGSRHYAENPIFPNQQMVAEIQMDMIGRREEAPNPEQRTPESPDDNVNTVHLVGTQRASDALHQLCLDLNDKHVGFVFEYDQEGMFGRSDHANFARQDIPVAFLFTGLHPQYHQPDDTVEKIDFPKLARIAQFAYALAFEIADRDERLPVDRTWAEISGRRDR